MGLKDDGRILAWGWNCCGQTDVPLHNTGFVVVAAGRNHSIGLNSDGTIINWGSNSYGQADIPSLNAGLLTIAGGYSWTLAIRRLPGDFQADGRVDWDDLREFVVRFAGPGFEPDVDGWRIFDLDSDHDVDLWDFGVVQNGFTGE